MATAESSAKSSPRFALRQFFESRRRERVLQESWMTGAPMNTTEADESRWSNGDASDALSEERVQRAVSFIVEVEECPSTSDVAMAVVNVIKAYVMGRTESARLGFDLLGADNDKLTASFAAALGSTVEELAKAKREHAKAHRKSASSSSNKSNLPKKKKAPAPKKNKSSSSSSADNYLAGHSSSGMNSLGGGAAGLWSSSSPQHRLDSPAEAEQQQQRWRVSGGDERLGTYCVVDNSLARVEAWSLVPPSSSSSSSGDEAASKVFRATILLGGRRGQLVELSAAQLDEAGCSTSLDEQLGKLDDPASLEGASAPPFADAIRRVCLAVDESWAKRFGDLVWAHDKPTEPLWPAIVLDLRSLEDAALFDRALKLLGKKHVVKFLGMPHASSLGFVPPSNLRDYDKKRPAPPEADDDRADHRAKRLKKAKSVYYSEALRQAKELTAGPPPPADSNILVTYLGDDKVYRCTVLNDPDTPGALLVRSADFGPEEPEIIPFDPVEDDWEYPPAPAPAPPTE